MSRALTSLLVGGILAVAIGVSARLIIGPTATIGPTAGPTAALVAIFGGMIATVASVALDERTSATPRIANLCARCMICGFCWASFALATRAIFGPGVGQLPGVLAFAGAALIVIPGGVLAGLYAFVLMRSGLRLGGLRLGRKNKS